MLAGAILTEPSARATVKPNVEQQVLLELKKWMQHLLVLYERQRGNHVDDPPMDKDKRLTYQRLQRHLKAMPK